MLWMSHTLKLLLNERINKNKENKIGGPSWICEILDEEDNSCVKDRKRKKKREKKTYRSYTNNEGQIVFQKVRKYEHISRISKNVDEGDTKIKY